MHGNNSCIISNIDEVEDAIENFQQTGMKKLLIVSQTTFSLVKFNDIAEKIRTSIAHDVKLVVKNTICMATELRQKETEEISKQVDLMIVIRTERTVQIL